MHEFTHQEKKWFKLSAYFALAFACMSPSVYAQPGIQNMNPAASLTAQQRAEYLGLFKQKTGLIGEIVAPSPIAGFVAVRVGASMYYMETSGKWLFDGALVNLDTKRAFSLGPSLGPVATNEKQGKQYADNDSLPLLDWKNLILTDAIKTVQGRPMPGRVLVVFKDPNCGHCRKLESEIKKLQDVTVFTFPISVMGPSSQQKNQDIWCSKDRLGNWERAMRGESIKQADICDTSALGRNAELSIRLGVTGTPTTFFADGTRHEGFASSTSLNEKIEFAKPKAGIRQLN
jgi:thiol:disulfide interchange protein DsbC